MAGEIVVRLIRYQDELRLRLTDRLFKGCATVAGVLRVALETTSHMMLYLMLNNMFQEVYYVAHKPFGRYPFCDGSEA
jgi:hypothetical protein